MYLGQNVSSFSWLVFQLSPEVDCTVGRNSWAKTSQGADPLLSDRALTIGQQMTNSENKKQDLEFEQISLLRYKGDLNNRRFRYSDPHCITVFSYGKSVT